MVECSICGKVFKYESECRRHELSHLPRYNCDCGKKFTYLSALRRHQKQHERTGSIECDKCKHSFKDEALLKRHIKYAHDGTHICSECNAKFNSNQALGIHKLTHKPKSERKYICSFMNCNKTFNFSHQLKYHEMTHTNTKQYFCKICGKGFIQAHNLKVHMKIHEPSEWLPCEIVNCKKKFPTEYARKKHYARHKKAIKEEKVLNYIPNTIAHQTDQLITLDNLSSISKEAPASPFAQEHQIKDENNKIVKKLVIEPSNKQSQEDFSLNKLTDFDDFTTCKTILGRCLVTGNTSINENCLCDQMTKSNDDSNTTLKVRAVNDINEKFSNTALEECTTTNCENCSCDSAKYDKNSCALNESKTAYSSCSPEFEYGKNGTVKVINTVDIDFDDIVTNNNNNNVTKRNDLIEEINDNKTIPYNSCKAVLGKCIVSENGMMNEDCLCAKMAMEEPQMTSQEIDEITPQCYDSSCMCL